MKSASSTMSPFVTLALLCLALGVPTGTLGSALSKLEEDNTPANEVTEFTKECPKGDGIYGDTDDCAKFYHCYDGVRTETKCRDGNVFDPKLAQITLHPCNQPTEVDCSGKKGPRKIAYLKMSDECPMDGNFAVKEDCTKFISCSHMKPHVKQCDTPLVYNSDMGVCVYEYQSNRDECKNLTKFDCSLYDPIMEQHNKDEAKYPHPDDCRLYFQCRYQVSQGILLACPLGKLFSDRHDACLYVHSKEARPKCKNYYIKVKKSKVPLKDRDPLEVNDKDPYYKNYMYIPRSMAGSYKWIPKKLLEV